MLEIGTGSGMPVVLVTRERDKKTGMYVPPLLYSATSPTLSLPFDSSFS